MIHRRRPRSTVPQQTDSYKPRAQHRRLQHTHHALHSTQTPLNSAQQHTHRPPQKRSPNVSPPPSSTPTPPKHPRQEAASLSIRIHSNPPTTPAAQPSSAEPSSHHPSSHHLSSPQQHRASSVTARFTCVRGHPTSPFSPAPCRCESRESDRARLCFIVDGILRLRARLVETPGTG